jgi:hypothetical protein
VQPLEWPDRARADGELHPPVELLRVLELRLGEDDGKLVAADAARDIRASHDRLQRSATPARTESPARCPMRSLIALKSSMSKTTRASCRS